MWIVEGRRYQAILLLLHVMILTRGSFIASLRRSKRIFTRGMTRPAVREKKKR
jgi:hypothetical protein